MSLAIGVALITITDGRKAEISLEGQLNRRLLAIMCTAIWECLSAQVAQIIIGLNKVDPPISEEAIGTLEACRQEAERRGVQLLLVRPGSRKDIAQALAGVASRFHFYDPPPPELRSCN